MSQGGQDQIELAEQISLLDVDLLQLKSASKSENFSGPK
jgi:hypothetical protein